MNELLVKNKLLLTGEEMIAFQKGVAVNTRHSK